MKKLSHSLTFSENVVINVVYYDKACAINSFSSDNFYTKTFVTFSLSSYANNLISLFFVIINVCDGNDISSLNWQKHA